MPDVVSKPQSVPAIDAVRVADALDSIRHDFGMFDVVGGRVDDTGDERHPGGKRMALEASILVVVARIPCPVFRPGRTA
jgi:hypothetical protein